MEKLEEEIAAACYDEYAYGISGGLTEEAAYRQCIADVEGIVKEHVKKPKFKFAFALAVSFFAFLISLIEILIGTSSDALSIYGFEMAVVSLGFIGLLIYATATRKKDIGSIL